MATGLGTCTDDPTGALISAADSRSCWEPAIGPMSTMGTIASDGFFSELEPVAHVRAPEPAQPVRIPPAIRETPDHAVRANATTDRSGSTKPDLETAGRAAWVPPDEDRLVEAPAVRPEKRLTTKVQRRRRRWFR